jgi:hypothetical protein
VREETAQGGDEVWRGVPACGSLLPHHQALAEEEDKIITYISSFLDPQLIAVCCGSRREKRSVSWVNSVLRQFLPHGPTAVDAPRRNDPNHLQPMILILEADRIIWLCGRIW